MVCLQSLLVTAHAGAVMKDSTDMLHSGQAQEITSLIQGDLLIFCAAAIPEYKGVQDEAVFPGMDSVYSINERY